MAPQPPLYNFNNKKKMPRKPRIVFGSEDSSSSEDEAELGAALRRLASGVTLARPPPQASAAAADNVRAEQEKDDTVSLFGISQGEFEAANSSSRESDNESPVPAAPNVPGNAVFPPGLLDGVSIDDSLLVCLPIGSDTVEKGRTVSTETVGASGRASVPSSAGGLSNNNDSSSSDDDDDDSSSSDDSSDDGFYDKKVPAKDSGMAKGKDDESSDDDDDFGQDGLYDSRDTKMPAKRSFMAKGNDERSNKSAGYIPCESEGRNSDGSSLLSSGEDEQDENTGHGAVPKGSANSSVSSGSDSQPSSSSEDVVEEVLNQAVSSTSSNEGTVSRDYDPQIGDRVYARYDENDDTGWYWGNTSGHENGYYSIEFEDGDSKEKVSRKNPDHILTVWEYMSIFGTDLPPVKENDEIVPTLSPRQMYASRCKWCDLCEKPDCGSCATCKKNSRALSNHDGRREVCLQKMCLRIPLAQKKQPAYGLPSNWTFCFDENTKYHPKGAHAHVPGLFIYHAKYEKKTFRSIEAAVVYVPKLKEDNRTVVTDFYNHIGITRGNAKGGASKRKRAEPLNSRPAPQKPITVGSGTVLSPKDLYANRCKKCELCMKEDCGSCASCMNNLTASSNHEREVCLQKMCLAIPLFQKKQPAEGLPPNWTFVFMKDTRYGHASSRYHTPGLFIYHPEHETKTYRSIEAAAGSTRSINAFNPSAIENFNTHIGILRRVEGDDKKIRAEPKSASVAAPQKPNAAGAATTLSPQDLYTNRCKQCELCKKQDCGSCWSCKSNGKNPVRRRAVCLQKMCCKIPTEQKAQPMPRAAKFPNGWRYVVDPTRKSFKKNVGALGPSQKGAYGLTILPPRGQEYYSAERAKSHRKFHEASVDAFYEHMGASRPTLSSQARTSVDNAAMSEALSSTVTNTTSSRNCGLCGNCTKPPCGKCARCINSPNGSSEQCFQKMCYELPVDAKAERAVGLPKGWHFYFAMDVKWNGGPFTPVPGLFILTKGGKKFRSVKASACLIKGDESEAARKFYTHVGLLDTVDQGSAQVVERPSKRSRTDNSAIIADYSLVGRDVCFNWTDVTGQTKVVYGTVAPCEVDDDGNVDKFKVIFDPQSRIDVNSTTSEGMPAVPESRIFPLPIILGGCIALEQQIARWRESPLMEQVKNEHEFMNWVVPNWRKEDQVAIANAERLPRLTLTVRGHRLELNIKQSTIPDAGYGVYVSCTSLTKGPDGRPMGPFVLQAGEMLDLGVYGPFRLQDKKLQAVFFAKNFIFSHECEEWVHQAGDSEYQLDITNDGTGEIHEEAKKHILAYVNENSALDRVCVRAEHDAQDNVHYLLGHEHQSQGSFIVPSDGSEVEVFTHYLDGYEKVRIRKGYSFLSDGEEKKRLLEEIASEDVDDIVVINGYDAVDVKACVHFLAKLVSEEKDFDSGEAIKRTLIVAVILQRRAKWFLNSQSEGDSGVKMEKVFECSARLVSHLLTMNRDGNGDLQRLQTDGNVDKVLVHALKSYFSAHEFSKLSSDILIKSCDN